MLGWHHAVPACPDDEGGTGFIHRAMAASPRTVSHPNAIGSRRIIRSRICCRNKPEHPGRELASEHERLTCQLWREVVECIAGCEHNPSHACSAVAHQHWTSAPPVSLPTRVTS